MFTNFQGGSTSMGMIAGIGGIPPATGPVFIVGTDPRFVEPNYPYIQSAINACGDYGGTIIVQPGSYDEAVTIPRTSTSRGAPITIVGMQGHVAIEPSTTDANALVNDCDNVTLINIGLAANGTGIGCINTGSRFRAYGGKWENDDGTGACGRMTIQTVAQRAAHTKGNGADCLLSGVEFAWAGDGLEIMCTDQGAVTELQIVNGWFHDILGDHIYETVGSGGAAAVMYNSLKLQGNVHQKAEDGSAPNSYVTLNGDNANTGIMAGCVFPQALAGGLVLLSTALVCVGSFFTGGLSTTQPS